MLSGCGPSLSLRGSDINESVYDEIILNGHEARYQIPAHLKFDRVEFHESTEESLLLDHSQKVYLGACSKNIHGCAAFFRVAIAPLKMQLKEPQIDSLKRHYEKQHEKERKSSWVTLSEIKSYEFIKQNGLDVLYLNGTKHSTYITVISKTHILIVSGFTTRDNLKEETKLIAKSILESVVAL